MQGFSVGDAGDCFKADTRVLQLKGCDMVLGIQWLANLGPVKWDFKNLSIEFSLNGGKHVLRGGKKDELKLVGLIRCRSYCRNSHRGP